MVHKITKTNNYLLVVDDSIQQIKKGEYFLLGGKHVNMWGGLGIKALATISHKIIAHFPLNFSPILEGVPLLPPYSRHQEDGVGELALHKWNENDERTGVAPHIYQFGFTDGYNKAREKYKYTEDDLRKAIEIGRTVYTVYDIIEYLHKYPTEFECEMVWVNSYNSEVPVSSYDVQSLIPKTITTTQGVQWVGKYK